MIVGYCTARIFAAKLAIANKQLATLWIVFALILVRSYRDCELDEAQLYYRSS